MGNWHRGGGTGGIGGRLAWYFAREVARGLANPQPVHRNDYYYDVGSSYSAIDSGIDDSDSDSYNEPIDDNPLALEYGTTYSSDPYIDLDIDLDTGFYDDEF